jgi:hypothetical protein
MTNLKKMVFLRLCLLLVFCLFYGSPSMAQDMPDETALRQIYFQVVTIHDLQARGILTPDEATAQRDYYLAQTENITGTRLTFEQLATRIIPSDTPPPTGFFNFVNIIWFIASILIVVALSWLARLYLFPILRRIPLRVYEKLIYLACLVSMVGGLAFAPHIGQFIALPGCLGLIGARAFSIYLNLRHVAKDIPREAARALLETIFQINALLLFVVWTINALAYQSSILGFIAVMALQAALGFSAIVTPLCYFIGFRNKEAIPRTMAASLLLLIIYAGVYILGLRGSYFDVFAPGVYVMGTLAYFVGVLIVSSRFYVETRRRWLQMQALAIISGVVALFVGSVWQLEAIQGIGGTFFFLYLIERYLEIPGLGKRWAWALLGLGILLYMASLVITQYPQFFIFAA